MSAAIVDYIIPDILKYRPPSCRLVSQAVHQISSALRELTNVSTMFCLTGDLHRKSAEMGATAAKPKIESISFIRLA